MGIALFQSKDFPACPLNLFGLKFSCVSFGNPHAVAFVAHIEKFPLETLGPSIEHHAHFPSGINVEIVEIINKKKIKVRVWERGSGLTLSCGTGACAAFAICHLQKKVDDTLSIILPGGELEMHMNKNKEVLMTGGVKTVFEGWMDGLQ